MTVRKPPRPVVAVDTVTGRITARYDGVRACAEATGISADTLYARCRFKRMPYTGFTAYRYADDPDVSAHGGMVSPVLAIDQDGNVAGSWPSVRAAAPGLGYSEHHLCTLVRKRAMVLYKGVACTLVRPNRADPGAS